MFYWQVLFFFKKKNNIVRGEFSSALRPHQSSASYREKSHDSIQMLMRDDRKLTDDHATVRKILYIFGRGRNNADI